MSGPSGMGTRTHLVIDMASGWVYYLYIGIHPNHSKEQTMRSHTTVFTFDNGTYFAAHTDNGGFRVGMNNLCAIEFPAGHPTRTVAESLTEETVEEFIDEQVSIGNIRFM